MDNLTFHSHKNHNPDCDILVKHIDKDTNITFVIFVKNTINNKKGDIFMELYIGKNYNVNSTKKSYSRYYTVTQIPKKYLTTFIELQNEYVEKYL